MSNFHEYVEKYDALIYYYSELGLDGDELYAKVRELFPDYDPHTGVLDYEVKTGPFLDEYALVRQTGLSPVETIHAIGKTSHFLKMLMTGEGLTLKWFVEFAKMELFAYARFKRDHFVALQSSANKGKWRASVSALEKILPQEFTPSVNVNNKTDITLSSSDCEKRSQQARIDLERMRQERQKELLDS